jgi:magnesium transporter
MLHYASGRYLESILDFEDRLGDMEEMLLSDKAEDAMKKMVSYRSRLRVLRRVFSYHLRLAESIMNSSTTHFTSDDEMQHERRDLYDRSERLYSLCTMYYEICGDLLDGHISLSSHRLNNTMKILTIITAIFVPLSFLAGVYGMNFEHIPELGFRYGYFILLGVMASAVTGMLFMFRKLKWL